MASLSNFPPHTVDGGDSGVNGPERTPRLTVLTMGCRVNQFESAALGQGALGRGFELVEAGEAADLVVINTCSVTGESDRQARQMIRRAVRDHPGARIVVTGCYAQRAPETLAALPGVDLVLGNGEKSRMWAVLEEIPARSRDGESGAGGRIRVGDVAALTRVPEAPPVAQFGDRTRAFVQVQDGCDRACAYCLIPGVRGPSRSLDPLRVLEQARRFLESGYEELVLTGVNLGSWGRDLAGSPALAGLVAALLELPGLGRLRLSSLDPLDIDSGLVALLATRERLCGHLHLSIQSGDDGVRRRMGRGRGRGEVLRRIERVREARPELVLGADLIVGFPSEDGAAFARTLELVREGGLALLHVFPYSERPGTTAANMPAAWRVAGERIQERARALRRAGEAELARVAGARTGRRELVLVERIEAGWGEGKSDGFLSVAFPDARAEWRGRLLPVRVEGFDAVGQRLLGRVEEGGSSGVPG